MGNTEYSIRWLQPQTMSRAARELLSIDNGSVVAIMVPKQNLSPINERPEQSGSRNLIHETPSRMGSKDVKESHSKENVLQDAVLPSWVTIPGSPGKKMTLYIKAGLQKQLNKNLLLESLQFVEMRRYRFRGILTCIDCCLYKCVITAPARAGARATEQTLLVTTFNGMLVYSDPDKIEWRYLT